MSSYGHCSTSIKLGISHGDIKAVQGDTGHAQARMVTDVYAHTHDDVRRSLAQKMEDDFFQRGKDMKAPATEEPENPSAAVAYRLLLENPQLAQLVIAAAQMAPSK